MKFKNKRSIIVSFNIGGYIEYHIRPLAKAGVRIGYTDIERYEWADKCGGYAIQGKAGVFVKSIEGDYFNVVGLPVNRLYCELKKLELI